MREPRPVPMHPPRFFLKHLARSAGVAGVVVIGSLGLGVLGYHRFGGLDWLDALVNASMILAGMGPVDPITSVSGKLFESFYALFSGVTFLTIAAVLLAPAVHRFLHRFHLELADEPPEKKS
ncbi:MAG TPA: hypothetical protein VEW47_15835 [Candidatus Dormibacteraeota bacterium]|nr:hypothetical protein [Candidatus Dormibacteraeota bacterium]